MFKTTGNRQLLVSLTALAGSLAVTSGALANVEITPYFDSSIPGNVNAAAIEGAIDSAISTFSTFYSNNLNITVDVTYDPAAAGNLLSTTQYYYDVSYKNYVNALKANSTANPSNSVLATAIANLSKGNDANGAKDMALAGTQMTMLGLGTTNGIAPVININSSQVFAFSRPVPNNEFDLVGGLEHELDEVLGGGGAGSNSQFLPIHLPRRVLLQQIWLSRSLSLLRFQNSELYHFQHGNFILFSQRRSHENRRLQP